MYRINATPVHCFARGCPHRDPAQCLMRVPPFYIKKSKSSACAQLRHSISVESMLCASGSEHDGSLCSKLTSDRLAKSRATGQSHRDSEREHIIYLLTAIQNGRLENTLLFVMFTHAYKRNRMLRFGAHHSISLSASRSYACHTRLGMDFSEDVVPHLKPFMYPISRPCQVMLGQRTLSGATASALLELLMHRRNMWGTTHAMRPHPVDGEGHRRRPPYRAATTMRDAEAIVQFASRLYCREIASEYTDSNALRDHVQLRLGNFAMAAYNVDHIEATVNPVYSLSQYMYDIDYMYLPRSPTTPDTAEFGSPVKIRRMDGAKRCTRCGVLKIAGSGHGRSKCADGMSISSPVPYPASPARA